MTAKTLQQIHYEAMNKIYPYLSKETIDKIFGEQIKPLVRKWLQQKETDDFGGEMTATEFKNGLLAELEEAQNID